MVVEEVEWSRQHDFGQCTVIIPTYLPYESLCYFYQVQRLRLSYDIDADEVRDDPLHYVIYEACLRRTLTRVTSDSTAI